MNRKRILFSGAARVHFVCAFPVVRRLAPDPRVEFWFTGGFKQEENDAEGSYRLDGFYDPFPVDRSRVIPVERAGQMDFDVLLAAHKSPPKPRSVGKSVQLFHGVSFKNLGVREKYLQFDHLCLAGPYHAEVYRKKGFVRKSGQCLVTGVPKLDPLVAGGLDRDALLHYHGLDPARPTILYAPTGSRFNSMETMGLEVIREIARVGAWNLMIKLHDHPKDTSIDWAGRIAELESDRVRLIHAHDVVPYLHAADLLLTDASSVSVEYTLLDRPIVFLDVPELLNDVVDRGGALDLETHGRKMGHVMRGPGEVPSAVAVALARPERERAERRATAQHVFHDPGRATERAAGIVLFAAGLASELPQGVVSLEPEARPVEMDAS